MRIIQKFDDDYNFMCIGCHKTVDDGHLYVEVRQRDMVDSDTKLACHVACLGGL